MADILDAYIPFRGDGNDWEQLVHALLVLRHGPTNYSMVPATHGGDYGLDGFSYDGHAYQCYAAEDCTTDELYRKQQSKMTRDVAKFISNKTGIAAMLGSVQPIARWCFVVPFFSSRSLLEHAAKKTAQIRKAQLPYAATDIIVHVDPLAHFRAELATHLSSGRNTIHIEPPVVSDEEIERWRSSQSDYLTNLNRKLAAQGSKPDKKRIAVQSGAFVRNYIAGLAIQESLRKDNPKAYTEIIRCTQALKRRLEAFTPSNAGASATLRYHFDELVDDLEQSVQALSKNNIEMLGHCYLAQYLMDCTMEIN